MTRARDVIFAIAQACFGAMWLVAAASKLAAPLAAYEFTARLVPAGGPAKSLFAATIAAETLLGAAMLLRVLRGFALSLVLLCAATAGLLIVRAQAGMLVPCGCFGDLMGTTLDGAILRNAVLAALLVALILWGRVARGTATIPPCPSSKPADC